MAAKKAKTASENNILDILPTGKSQVKTARTSIIYDGRQYSIRIPKKLAKTVGIDKKKDVFEFQLEIPPTHREEPKLTGRLIKAKR